MTRRPRIKRDLHDPRAPPRGVARSTATAPHLWRPAAPTAAAPRGPTRGARSLQRRRGMDLTYQLSKHVDGFRAVCCEHPHLEGAGPTEDDALRSLRETVRDKFRHVEALAPPEDSPPVEVSLRRVEHPSSALPDGPGAPPSPDGPGAAPERASRPS